MQILRGTKREITLMQWNEQLAKANKRLEDSKECYRRFGDENSKQWIVEDEKKVAEIEQNSMRKNGIIMIPGKLISEAKEISLLAEQIRDGLNMQYS